MLDQLLIVGIYLLIIYMCSYVTLEYRKNKISKQHFLIWLIFIFLTGPIGFIIYIFWDKKKSANFKKGNRM
ncbi:hypothetical protein ABE42_19845 [Bacillus thuringiensis]|nr:hypothetical protein [Bacillus thuringiensis]